MKSNKWIIPVIIRQDFTIEFPEAVTEQEALASYQSNTRPFKFGEIKEVETFTPDWAKKG